jgi:cold shock CspA family protein
MQGACKEFDPNKGYGTIIGEDGGKYFCHFSAIQSSSIKLEEGDAVTFTPAANENVMHGKMATLVKHT